MKTSSKINSGYFVILILIFIAVFLIFHLNSFFISKLKLRSEFSSIGLFYQIIYVLNLLPILVWPVVGYVSVFHFDNPSNHKKAIIEVILILLYPIYLIGLEIFALGLGEKNPIFTQSILIGIFLIEFFLIGIFLIEFFLIGQFIGFPKLNAK